MTDLVMDPADPQREEILRAVSNVFNTHNRGREADECIDAIKWLGAV